MSYETVKLKDCVVWPVRVGFNFKLGRYADGTQFGFEHYKPVVTFECHVPHVTQDIEKESMPGYTHSLFDVYKKQTEVDIELDEEEYKELQKLMEKVRDRFMGNLK